MFPLYTKTFGGKIWENLHSVSPGNFFGKIFKMASLEIFPPKNCKQHLVQKNEKRQFLSFPLKSVKYTSLKRFPFKFELIDL